MLAAKIIGDLGSISVGLIYVFFAVGMYNGYNFSSSPIREKQSICYSAFTVRILENPSGCGFGAHHYLQAGSAAAPVGGCIYAVCAGANKKRRLTRRALLLN